MIDYRLIRSERRTLSIQIDREGALVVRAPKRMSRQEIDAFIRRKREWIEEKQLQAKKVAAVCAQPEAGASVPFWGGTVRIGFGDISEAVCQEGTLWLPWDGETVQHARKWRLQQAQALVTPRVEYWAVRTGLRPERTAYGNAGARWGSMNPQTRSLRLNAALVHCPPEAVDYVIVHELVHILHPDHSPAFHAAVRRVLPDADQRRAALKQCGALIRLWK